MAISASPTVSKDKELLITHMKEILDYLNLHPNDPLDDLISNLSLDGYTRAEISSGIKAYIDLLEED